jgi:hypothetical protein
MTKSRTLGLFSATVCLALGGCNPSLTGGVSTTSQIEAITSARILRLYQAFASTIIPSITTTTAPATVYYDGNLYYYKVAVSGTVTTLTFYYDSGATISEGTATVTNISAGGDTNQTYSVVFNITVSTASTRPMTGTLTVVVPPGNSPITINGTVNENSSSAVFPLTVSITNTNGNITGTATGVAFGTTVTYSNLVGTTTTLSTNPLLPANAYTLTGTAALGTTSGSFSESIATDGSGSYTSSLDGTGLQWSRTGSATLTIPNADGTINIANVDSGQ